MAGIKELSEALDGIAILMEIVGKCLADDKIGFNDAKYLMDLVKEKEALLEAFKGLDLLDDELKDLDAEEAKEVIGKVFEIVGAYKKGKSEG